MYNTSESTRNLLKYGIVFAFITYYLYQFVMEYLSGKEAGFTPVIFAIGLVILGGGSLFTGYLTLKAWKASQQEAAEAIAAQERAKAELEAAEEE